MNGLEVAVIEQPPQSNNNGKILSRLGSLLANIMAFIMDSGGFKYDPYFFTPALLALQGNEFQFKEFLEFFAQDFSLQEHAKDFEFSDNETKVEFAKRFFAHIAATENVPDKIRALAAKFAKGFRVRCTGGNVNGFLKPCPIYAFVRAVSLFLISANEVRGLDMIKVETIIEFLLNDFDPKVYGIEDEATVHDIVTMLGQAFGGNNTIVVLPDGITARQRSRELLELLADHEAVPENVKQAVAEVLPCF